MSNISKKPKLGKNNEILYSMNIYFNEGKLKVELGKDGNIKTNIDGLIDRIIEYKENGKIIMVDHDLYYKINNGTNPITMEIKDEIYEILRKIYGINKKVA